MANFTLKPFLPFPDMTVQGNFLIEKKRFQICYQVFGNLNVLKIPAYVLSQQRVDKLWERTCFELFVKPSREYVEFNFAPDNTWNAFHFDDYRQNKQDYQIVEPIITTEFHPDCFSLTVSLPSFSQCQIGISCVLASKDGSRSYWALEHLRDKPDFHVSESFIHKNCP